MGEIAEHAATLAAELDRLGLRRGDVVLTLLGNRPEWVLTLTACFRQGYVVLPCTEQLRPNDLRLRLEATRPRARRVRRAQRRGAGRRRLERRHALVPLGRAAGARSARAGGARARGPVPDHVHVRYRRRT